MDYEKKKISGKVVTAHRIRAEKALGRPLPKGVDVHHADGSRSSDAPLVICQDRAYHMLLHRRMRVKELGGDPNTDVICKRCRRVVKIGAARQEGKQWIQWTCRANCGGVQRVM